MVVRNSKDRSRALRRRGKTRKTCKARLSKARLRKRPTKRRRRTQRRVRRVKRGGRLEFKRFRGNNEVINSFMTGSPADSPEGSRIFQMDDPEGYSFEIDEIDEKYQDYAYSKIRRSFLFSVSGGHSNISDSYPDMIHLLQSFTEAGVIGLSEGVTSKGSTASGKGSTASGKGVSGFSHRECMFISSGKNHYYFTVINLAIPDKLNTDPSVEVGICCCLNSVPEQRLLEYAQKSHIFLHRAKILSGRYDRIDKTNDRDITSPFLNMSIQSLLVKARELSQLAFQRFMASVTRFASGGKATYGTNCHTFSYDLFKYVVESSRIGGSE